MPLPIEPLRENRPVVFREVRVHARLEGVEPQEPGGEAVVSGDGEHLEVPEGLTRDPAQLFVRPFISFTETAVDPGRDLPGLRGRTFPGRPRDEPFQVLTQPLGHFTGGFSRESEGRAFRRTGRFQPAEKEVQEPLGEQGRFAGPGARRDHHVAVERRDGPQAVLRVGERRLGSRRIHARGGHLFSGRFSILRVWGSAVRR